MDKQTYRVMLMAEIPSDDRDRNYSVPYCRENITMDEVLEIVKHILPGMHYHSNYPVTLELSVWPTKE